MDTINMVYVDDKLDPYVSEYLTLLSSDEYLSSLSSDEYEYKKEEIEFSKEDSYKSMLSIEEIRTADILFLDSMLFENNGVNGNKLSGEELGFIIKKIFPYKEIIVITQHQNNSGFSLLKKYNSNTFGLSPSEFFKQYWEDTILQASHNIVRNRKILEKLSSKHYVEKMLLEKLEATMSGQVNYENLTKTDIDKLIESFEEMRKVYDEDRL